jgi:TonB family protein
MKCCLLFLGLVFYFSNLPAQNGQEIISFTRDSVRLVRKNCLYPGKMEGLLADIEKKMVLPRSAKSENIQGKVFLRLTVGPDGKVIGPSVLHGFRGDVDQAIIKACLKLRRFEPASMNGQKVTTSILVPINICFAPGND